MSPAPILAALGTATLLCLELCGTCTQCHPGTGAQCGAAVSPHRLRGRFRGIPEGCTPVHKDVLIFLLVHLSSPEGNQFGKWAGGP